MKTYQDKAIKIEREDLPGIYYEASEASMSAQRTFLRLIKLNIFFLVVLSTLSSINISFISKEYQFLIPLISTFFLILTIMITFATDSGKYEKKWYDGRAIAESLKTLSWKFMMKAQPFLNLSKADAETKFLEDFKEIKNAIKPAGDIFGSNPRANMHQLTDTMKKVYNSDLETRKGTYELNRIQNQQNWYKKNTTINSKKAEYFYWIIIICQLVAILCSFAMIYMPNSIFNPTGFIATIISAFMTWTQLKKYQNLAESYGITSVELGLIQDTIPSISSDEQFSRFVAESETAISREHTFWRARRTIQ